eukprot:11174905-Lingulodinium_polyedra.AAC.1
MPRFCLARVCLQGGHGSRGASSSVRSSVADVRNSCCASIALQANRFFVGRTRVVMVAAARLRAQRVPRVCAPARAA